jgi:trans-2-enoyl-CoA reductase
MIIEPRMRGFVCLAHPDGSEHKKIKLNINQGAINGAKKVSYWCFNGFGLASRISVLFWFQMLQLLACFLKKPPTEIEQLLLDGYNSAAFERANKSWFIC